MMVIGWTEAEAGPGMSATEREYPGSLLNEPVGRVAKFRAKWPRGQPDQ
jgi:hypothetical protein